MDTAGLEWTPFVVSLMREVSGIRLPQLPISLRLFCLMHQFGTIREPEFQRHRMQQVIPTLSGMRAIFQQ